MSHHIMLFASRNPLVIFTFGQTMQSAGQFVNGIYGVSDGNTTEQEYQQQTYDDNHGNDIRQAVVTHQYAPLRRDEGKTPLRAWHRLVTDKTRITVKEHPHVSCFAVGHLITQGKDIGIRLGVGTVEDGMCEEQARVRRQEITPVFACHHEIGIRIRKQGVY